MYSKVLLSLLVGLSLSQEASKSGDGELRIVGGYEVEPKFKYPFMVSLQRDNDLDCGGTLYDASTVITAAHCSEDDIDGYRVVVHRHNLTKTTEEEKGTSYKVKKIVIHPNYDGDVENDIAIWKLDRPYTSSKKYIELDSGNLSAKTGTLAKALGWGNTKQDGNNSPLLMEVKVPVFDVQKCVQNYSKVNKTVSPTTMMCAGYPEGKRDSCQNDSGGPLFTESYGRYTLIGVVSWGEGCAKPKFPGVYVKVHSYINWIHQQL